MIIKYFRENGGMHDVLTRINIGRRSISVNDSKFRRIVESDIEDVKFVIDYNIEECQKEIDYINFRLSVKETITKKIHNGVKYIEPASPEFRITLEDRLVQKMFILVKLKKIKVEKLIRKHNGKELYRIIERR